MLDSQQQIFGALKIITFERWSIFKIHGLAARIQNFQSYNPVDIFAANFMASGILTLAIFEPLPLKGLQVVNLSTKRYNLGKDSFQVTTKFLFIIVYMFTFLAVKS